MDTDTPDSGPYREQAPTPALQQHFQCLWSSTVAEDYAGGFAVVPDGCVDIVFKSGRLLAVGPDRVAAFPELVAGTQVLGARFRPGAARDWLGLPLDEIVGQAVDLADIKGPGAGEFMRRMQDAAGARRQAVFREQLACMGQSTPAPDRRAAQLFELAGRGMPDGSQLLACMRAQLGFSERSLRRFSHAQFGYGPKTLERILRFQRLLALAAANVQAGMAELAAHAGYADQSHLSRELRALCGMGARAVLAQQLGHGGGVAQRD